MIKILSKKESHKDPAMSATNKVDPIFNYLNCKNTGASPASCWSYLTTKS
jgi:hypothetical protein